MTAYTDADWANCVDDRKSTIGGAFYLEEEVYMEQPEGFSLIDKEYYVCRLKKALYGLKQAPHAWYSRLDKYLQKQGFKRGGVDSILYIKAHEYELQIVVVSVDDIIFGSNK